MALVAWAQDLNWQFSHLSSYRLFPLFGLSAWSLIWSIYFVSWLRRQWNFDADKLKTYYKIVGLAAFGLILLHPGLLWWQLWRDGFGWPPGSYLNHYVSPTLKWAVILGSISWLIFIVYELRHRLKAKSWWRYVEVLADLAMVALFVHSLKLGSNLQQGWFRYVWIFYGGILLVCLIDIYSIKLRALKS